MQGMRIRAIRRALWLLAAPVLVVAVWLLVGFLGALVPGAVRHATSEGQQITIGLARGPIHYDLLLPLTPDLRARFAFAAEGGIPVDNRDAGWLIVGWGAREFYRTAGSYADITVSPVLRAITGDASVLRLEAYPAFDLGAAGIATVALSPLGYAALLARIEAELVRDASGQPVLSKAPGLTATDAFWEARSRFSALRTCNVWVGEVLREAGKPVGIWTPTPQALALSLWWFAV